MQIESGTSTVLVGEELVIKRINKTWPGTSFLSLFLNEVSWLNIMRKNPRVSSLIEFNNDDLTIVTEYCGEPLTKENAPDNIKEQFDTILFSLKGYNCRHCDIKPSDLLVKGGFITLIDFGWAVNYDQKLPESFPPHLGGEFRAGDDKGSMDKVLGWLSA